MVIARTLAPALIVLAGCLTERVEDAPPGTFVCAAQNDCDEGQNCILGICEAAEGPRLEIRYPEAFDRIDMPDDPSTTIAIPISVGGENLTLMEPHPTAEDRLGLGYVEVMVDGEVVAELTTGNLVAGVVVEVALEPSPGAHRITAVARTPSGARYDNIESTGTRLVWVDDGRPHVAFVAPWPGKGFSLYETSIEVELAAINYTFVPFEVQVEGAHGHAHLHYDDPFPACASDPECDCCYVAVVAPESAPEPGASPEPIEAYLHLPPAAAGNAELAVILRDTFHAPLFDQAGALTWDSVPIVRLDIPPSLGEESGGEPYEEEPHGG